MKAAVCVLLLFVAVSAALERRQQFGICVEACSPRAASSRALRSLGIGQCPPGQVCASNGCGHTCQPVSKCPQIYCFLPCSNGYKIGPDGCQTCTCNDAPATTPKCPGVMCAMYCEAGFQTGSDGCPICKCKDSNIVG